ncbi:MAG: pectinesterase family protein [Butyrivibrio sp.]|nr:pectinesterase family protein [Muribaculum sp.]MCM1551608.1 pectinesterase family protein [Butyrivibrio sp.]
MADGGTVTLKVYSGDTTIILGGCQFSSGTVALGDGTPVTVKTTKCTNEDGTVITDESNQIKLEYTSEEEGEVVLTFADKVYCPFIIVSGKRPKPTITDVDVDVTVSTNDLLPTGATITLEKSGGTAADAVDVTTGGKKKLSVKATYSAVIKKDNAVVEGLAAKLNDADKITVTEDLTELAITIVTTVLKVTPAITGDDFAEAGYKLYATDGKNDPIELSNGVAVTLSKNTEYTLEVREDKTSAKLDDWLVSIDDTDSNKFKTGSDESQAISVAVKHVTEVKITPAVTGLGMLGDNKLYMKAGDSKVAVVSGEAMTLQPNTEYTLVIETAAGAAVQGIEAAIGGKTSYKTAYTDAKVEISVSVPATKTTKYEKAIFAKDKGTGIAEGQVLPGTNILYAGKTSGSGVSYDDQLRFRSTSVLWLPLQDDTTRITYIHKSNSLKTDRPVYIGSVNSGYSLVMPSGELSITIEDITDLIVEDKDGKKYLPIISGGDVKLDEIGWIEYNPVNTVTVSGKLTGMTTAVKKISFKALGDNDKLPLVTVDVKADGTYSAALRRVAGETRYAASIVADGLKIQDVDDADKFTLTGNGATATQNFTLVELRTSSVSGKVTGIDESLIKDELGVAFIPSNAALSPIPLELTPIKGGYSYKAVELEQGATYTIRLTDADDYEVKTAFTVPVQAETTYDIVATEKTKYEVKGKFVTSDKGDAKVSQITFKNMDTPAYKYTVAVTGNTYTAQLRTGEYETSVRCEGGYTAYDHVSVKDASVENDVYLQGKVDTSAVAYKEKVTVGAGEGKDFAKIADAVAYISRMTRTENQRVTIVLDKDATYREQLLIDTPNITIQGNGSKITWYYGVGFSYYSAKLSADGKSAYYDEAYAVDKYTKQLIGQNPGHWGATVNLLAGARGFMAEGLTFENSLNYYVTDEELADGAGANESSGVTARAKEINVYNKAAKERACVLYIQADDTEYKNCNFLSVQDTIYTGDAEENSYFVDCKIEGNTDYICGDGNPVFDKCTLSMYCYDDQEAKGCYIVANKAKATHGYLFKDCKIVTADREGHKGTSGNYLARAWDAGTCYFINTDVEKADMIIDAGYADMNAKASEATYYEYGTYYTDASGNKVLLDLSKRVKTNAGKWTATGNMTAEAVAALDPSSFFDGWVPSYYEGKITINELKLTVPTPVADRSVNKDVTSSLAAVKVKSVEWYEGDAKEAYTGETYKETTDYTVKVTLEFAKDRISIAPGMKVTVPGTEKVTATWGEGTGTISATYTTAVAGYYVIDLSEGLKTGVTYDGGLTVLQDMPRKDGSKEVDGKKYDVWIQGTDNPSPNKGEIPATGAAVKLVAEKKGKLNVTMADTGGKAVHFVDTVDGEVKGDALNITANMAKTHVLNVEAGHTYYLYGDGTKIVLCGNIIVDYRVIVPDPWENIANPEIVSAKVSATDPGTIEVEAKGQVGGKGADSMKVVMFNKEGNEVTSKTTITESNDAQLLTFTPSASGEYTFVAHLVRAGEEDKLSAASEAVNFKLPLAKPTISTVTNMGKGEDGKGALAIVWDAVPEAENYEVTITKEKTEMAKGTATAEETTITLGGLEIGAMVTVSVVAKRGEDVSEASTKDKLITEVAERPWAFTAYGSSISVNTDKINTSDSKNGYEEYADGSVKLWSTGGAGKVVPGSTDGLAFYYTPVDPETENFILTADVHVDSWNLSNGQDGFGLMVSDAVGKLGSGTAFWNNSYQLFATKIEYKWDAENNKVVSGDDESFLKYSMKLGLGWISKEGTTQTDVARIATNEISTPVNFKTDSGTLETAAALQGLASGTYNIVGNCKGGLTDDKGNITTPSIQELTDFKLQIARNADGYVLAYLDKDGNEIAHQTFYDDDRNKLTQIDKRNIYVGFVASRNATITVKNIKFESIDPSTQTPVGREETLVDPSYRIWSAKTSNSKYYELIFKGNADGKLNIVNETTGEVVASDVDITANKKYVVGTSLAVGKNVFKASFAPDTDYRPSQYEKLSDYTPQTLTHEVTYQAFENEIIYVAPYGTDSAAGTKEDPVDIYTAVAYASAGQKIYLAGGRYNLSLEVLIDRGHDGTEKKPIYMMADPEDTNRPVLNFRRQINNTSAFTIAGDYWYLKGFDVTRSKDGQKGIQLSGDYNVLEDIRTYENGNTGIQISRYQSDGREDWPAYNTVLNCTSYLNADAGYEDADGFAAKLTVGDGNRFVGCIAAYNADDGWDLFAKVQTGSIGVVTIENCLSFKNGYVIVDDEEKSAGNGNGFKMGGDSMSGYHVLKNSMAFGNKSKGIDSNSCPDIQVYNSTSFNNEGANVAFYTNTAVNTDYYAEGILSIKTLTGEPESENIKLKGTQNRAKVYGASNYYFDGSASVNTENHAASVDWFVSTDMAKAIDGGITRNTDGSINMGGFLELKETAPAGTGARLSQTSADVVLEKAVELNVYAGSYSKLSEVKLPESVKAAGYDWKYPNTEVSVFAGTTSEFVIAASGKEDKAAIVNFIEVTGVELVPDKVGLVGSDVLNIQAKPIVAPDVALENVQGDASITYDIKEASKLNLSIAAVEGKANERNITRAADSKDGLAKITAVANVTIGGKTTKKQATYSFTTRAAAFLFSYDPLTGVTVNADGSIIANKGDVITFNNLKVTGVGSNEEVKISVNDAKVLKVNGSAVTAVDEGTATITLTAAGDKTVVEMIPVTVRGADYKVNVTTITVDKAKRVGTQITALACYGSKMDAGSISVKKVLKGKNEVAYSQYFTVTHAVGNIYTIGVTDEGVNGLPKGTYNVVLQGKNGEAATEFEALTVKVIETKPTVSVKQTKKVNLFYKAGTASNSGTLTATSKQASVTLKQTNLQNADYRLEASGSKYSLVLKQSAAARPNAKITATVHFNGYKDVYDKDITISAKTENRAPKLKLEVDNKVLYTKIGITSTAIRFWDTTTKTYVSGADVQLTKGDDKFTLNDQNGTYKLALKGTKGGSVKLSVQDPDWNKAIVLNQSISVNDRDPKATVAAVKLNTAEEYVGKEQASALITVKNALDYEVKNLTLAGVKEKDRNMEKYLSYSVDVNDDGQTFLLVSVKQTAEDKLPANTKGTYNFKATFDLNGLTGLTANVKVSFINGATITTSQKGSIDLVNRTGSSVTVKPVLKNLNGKVVGMVLADDASNQFNVAWDSTNGAAVITAKEWVDLKKGGKYKVTPVFQVELNGGIVEIPVAKMLTIVPKQSSVKTTKLAVQELRLSSSGMAAMTTLKATSPAKAEILDMTQMNNTDKFAVSYDAQSDTVSVKLLTTRGLKANTTYKITMTLDVKDSGVNVKKQTIVVPVKVVK